MVTVLVDNACKYAGRGGTVEVATGTSAGRVTLTVDDSGPGVPGEHRDLVFDRFHRVDRAPVAPVSDSPSPTPWSGPRRVPGR